MTLTQSDRYLHFRRVVSRSDPSRYQMASMTEGYDADLLDWAFWARNIRGHSDNTIRVRMDFLHRLYQYIDRPLRDAQPGQLLRFERVAIAGRSAETRRAYACHVRAFYRWALQTGLITDDPSSLLTLPSVPKHLPRPIDEDDLSVAIQSARPKMRAMLTLAAWAGLRCCEIANLDWSDFQREPDGTAFLYIRGKGDKERRVEIGETVIKALQAYGPKRRGAMFIGHDGRQIEAKSVSRSINRYLQRHEVEATAHQLRHRYGTQAYRVSRDLRMVQLQMGHASSRTTEGYTRPSADAARSMVVALDALGLPSPRTVPLSQAGAGQAASHVAAP